MTPAARLQAAAEILDQLVVTRATAETVLKAWGQGHRYAGSKDRRAIADRVYRCLRARQRLIWAMQADERHPGRALVLGSLALIDGLPLAEIDALFSGQGYGPPPLSAQERQRLAAGEGDAPDWVKSGLPEFVVARFQRQFGDDWAAEATELMAPRAPIDLRVNGSRTTRTAMLDYLREAGLSPEPTPFSAFGIRLPAEPPPNLVKLDAYQNGLIEIQDEGSQLAAFIAGTGLLPGAQKVVDFCAGGGGKTLALTQMMAGEGEIWACDVVEKRLRAIEPRLARAQASAHFIHFSDPEDEALLTPLADADLVLVDAPCSGSGTWRRHPEEAHRLTEDEVRRLHLLQVQILGRAARCVKPGGRLVYVTCSVLDDENAESAEAFEAAHAEFQPLSVESLLKAGAGLSFDSTNLNTAGHRLSLSPYKTRTDGFFLAAWERLSR
ncbi:RsmB/NOP family class I SAM-dependent RNA methyltransferase [Asticcacaulis sp. EMRT-3]|uniref:RsmB/NOP family class I SAM-dependent RNA methyltransferase n=1 Tax=Asticcacaulis sp. EMRT-3 TaxID=3040349 RepID=UPI0024AF123C|nr:RsmB/NOP family class I SAM-dependent RNA methyltransferase [Asticcacaulis sp. EMRT-3]MDI7774654.1 RsmB/NOP family class I SAM-dependent RNA methyltransferase [Asticcacaulis sp. EMRT-3]